MDSFPSNQIIFPAFNEQTQRKKVDITNEEKFNIDRFFNLESDSKGNENQSPLNQLIQSPKQDKAIDSKNKILSDDNIVLEERSTQKKDKIPKKSKKKPKRSYKQKTDVRNARWTDREKKRYEIFVENNVDQFKQSSKNIRSNKLFIRMANFIENKTPKQCRSHHQKFFKRILAKIDEKSKHLSEINQISLENSFDFTKLHLVQQLMLRTADIPLVHCINDIGNIFPRFESSKACTKIINEIQHINNNKIGIEETNLQLPIKNYFS